MKVSSGWYMSSTPSIDPKFDHTIGSIRQPSNGVCRRVRSGVPWCFDNGAFAGKFEETKWLHKLATFDDYKSTCLFVVVPDVFGDCAATIAQFPIYRNKIKDWPTAFVATVGIERYASHIPWDDFDCLFIGGPNEHLLGAGGRWSIEQGRKHGKWVHVGRVNSMKRIHQLWEADSWDGTTLSYSPSAVRMFHAAVLQVRAIKQSSRLL